MGSKVDDTQQTVVGQFSKGLYFKQGDAGVTLKANINSTNFARDTTQLTDKLTKGPKKGEFAKKFSEARAKDDIIKVSSKVGDQAKVVAKSLDEVTRLGEQLNNNKENEALAGKYLDAVELAKTETAKLRKVIEDGNVQDEDILNALSVAEEFTNTATVDTNPTYNGSESQTSKDPTQHANAEGAADLIATRMSTTEAVQENAIKINIRNDTPVQLDSAESSGRLEVASASNFARALGQRIVEEGIKGFENVIQKSGYALFQVQETLSRKFGIQLPVTDKQLK